jgi:hypothetical protein
VRRFGIPCWSLGCSDSWLSSRGDPCQVRGNVCQSPAVKARCLTDNFPGIGGRLHGSKQLRRSEMEIKRIDSQSFGKGPLGVVQWPVRIDPLFQAPISQARFASWLSK